MSWTTLLRLLDGDNSMIVRSFCSTLLAKTPQICWFYTLKVTLRGDHCEFVHSLYIAGIYLAIWAIFLLLTFTQCTAEENGKMVRYGRSRSSTLVSIERVNTIFYYGIENGGLRPMGFVRGVDLLYHFLFSYACHEPWLVSHETASSYQSVAEISRHSVLSGDRIRQCGTSSWSRHKDTDVSRHFLLQAPQCPCSVRKRFSRDHCCRRRSKPGCWIAGSHTR